MSASKAALRGFAVETQVEDWGDLLLAVDRAINGVWSIECDGIAARIRRAARLVGPTPWREVDWGVYASGLYRAVLDGIDFEAPTEAEAIETDKLMEPYHNLDRFYRLHQAAIRITEKGIANDE
jgi:hypothetical protein